MADRKKKPEIRFKGFNDDWEERKLNEIADVIGGGTPSTSILEYWDGNIDWYSPTEIGKEIYANGSVKKITSLGLEKSSARMLPPEKTVLFTSRAGIGDMAILKRYGATNQGFQSLVMKDGIDPYFIYSIGHLLKEYALKYASGSTFLEITGKLLGNMDINIPLPSEQSKLGTFYKHLDHLITLHQRKYTKLVTLKKAMIEKMFPQNGAVVPEIRFKEFTEAWEEKELSDEVEFYTGLTYSPNDVIKEGGTLVLRSSNVKSGEIVYGDNVYVNSIVVNCDNVRMGDIIVVVRNGSRSLIGKHAQIKEKLNSTVIGAFMTGIRSNQSAFTNALLDTAQFDKEIEKNLGATINQITTGAFKKMQFMFPDSHEQQKIGNYFTHLDNLIAIQQSELEKLKNIKKACLEKMFV